LRNVKVLSLLILVLSATIAITTIRADPEQQRVYVNPESNEFSTTTTSVGDEFDVTIEAAGWPDPGVMSFEFKLRYDPTMLEPVLEKTNIDSEFWITEFIVRRGFDLDADPPQPFEDAEGPYLLFASSFLGAKGATGDGILAKAGFQIIAEPLTGQTLSSELEIADILMLNPSATAYAEDYYEVIDGTYQYSSIVAPNTPPEASNLAIIPSSPQTTDDLVGSYDYYDADGDTESGSETRWYKDAVLQTDYNDALTVPSSATSVGQEWYFTVKPSDGEDFGTLETSPPITIVTEPPSDQREDLNADGKIDIQDIAIWGLAFGSSPEHPRWNANADIDEDGKVGLLDGVAIAMKFEV
jgi:hypothetical protein